MIKRTRIYAQSKEGHEANVYFAACFQKQFNHSKDFFDAINDIKNCLREYLLQHSRSSVEESALKAFIECNHNCELISFEICWSEQMSDPKLEDKKKGLSHDE